LSFYWLSGEPKELTDCIRGAALISRLCLEVLEVGLFVDGLQVILCNFSSSLRSSYFLAAILCSLSFQVSYSLSALYMDVSFLSPTNLLSFSLATLVGWKGWFSLNFWLESDSYLTLLLYFFSWSACSLLNVSSPLTDPSLLEETS